MWPWGKKDAVMEPEVRRDPLDVAKEKFPNAAFNCRYIAINSHLRLEGSNDPVICMTDCRYRRCQGKCSQFKKPIVDALNELLNEKGEIN